MFMQEFNGAALVKYNKLLIFSFLQGISLKICKKPNHNSWNRPAVLLLSDNYS
jgi:hypothetical protein